MRAENKDETTVLPVKHLGVSAFDLCYDEFAENEQLIEESRDYEKN